VVSYASVDELASHLNALNLSTDQQRYFQVCLNTASRQIDGRCDISFSAASEARYFTPASSGMLKLGYATDVTAIDLDLDGDGVYETPLLTSDYQLIGEGQSTYIILRSTSSNTFLVSPQSIQVTARFGTEDVPDEVKMATILQAARLVKRRDAVFGVIANDAGMARINSDFDPDAKQILSDAGYLKARRRVIR